MCATIANVRRRSVLENNEGTEAHERSLLHAQAATISNFHLIPTQFEHNSNVLREQAGVGIMLHWTTLERC